MGKRYYIIGNGFDLHHGLPTKFIHFKKYLRDSKPHTYEVFNDFLGRYYSDNEIGEWNYFESMLGTTAYVEDHLDEAFESSESDTDRASYWHDPQYNAGIILENFQEVKKCFNEWAKQIDTKKAQPPEEIHFSHEDRFMNFNYTDSLQKLYGVERAQIFFIHGTASTGVIVGHNKEWSELPVNKTEGMSIGTIYSDEIDIREHEASEIINQIPNLFYKDSKSIIKNYQREFNLINEYDEVVFMGWSFGVEDKLYMYEIISRFSSDKSIKVIYYYEDKKVRKRYEDYLGPESSLVHYFTWDEIEKLYSIY